MIIGPPTVAEKVEASAEALVEMFETLSVITSTLPSCSFAVTTVVVISLSSGVVFSLIPATSSLVSLRTCARRSSTTQRNTTPTAKKIANTSPTTASADTVGSVPSPAPG